MAINSEEIWEQKQHQFSENASSKTFKRDYLKAVNNTLDEYSTRLNLSSHPAHITQTDESIDINANRGYVLEAGIDFWLIKYMHRSGDLDVGSSRTLYDDALRTAMLDRDNDLAATADADSDSSDPNPQMIGMFDNETGA